jgi:hypothetical protein
MSGVDKTDTVKGPMASSSTQYYWTKETKECVSDLWNRIEEYYNEMRRTGRLSLYRNSFTNFYAGWIYRASMYKSGEMGELTRSFWNHERNILLHLKSKVTQSEINYKAQVINSDARSAQVRETVDGLMGYITSSDEYKLGRKLDQSVEDSEVFGESSVAAIWNKFKGPDYLPGTSEGDIEYHNITPLDLIINTCLQERSHVQWKIWRRWMNKYDLAAMYPDQADAVKDLSDSESTYGTKLVTLIHHDNETIPVFYAFHEDTPAVPGGRFIMFADCTTIFEDGSLEDAGYVDEKGTGFIPIYDNIPSTMAGSPFGYTVAFDIIPLQQELNELVSAVTTNNINFATQCVMAPKGSNLHYQSLATGMTFIEWDPKMGPTSKPEALNLLHSAPETYQLIDKLIQNMEILAGVSALDRGVPDVAITSGQYAALITTNSIIFQAPLQRAYEGLCEKVATGTIRILQKNMKSDRVTQIVGLNNVSVAKTWGKDQLSGISGITVETINPMLKTPAGKMQLADVLMKSGLIKDPQQYIGVYTDGDLPQLYHRQETQLVLVKAENEELLKGSNLTPAITDNHVMHILEHTANIDTVEARLNPNQPYVVATLNHIMAHINMLTTINPVLAGIIGDPTLPPGTPSALQLQPPPPGQPAPQPQPGAPHAGPVPGAGPAGPPAPAQQQQRQPGGVTQPGQPIPNQGPPQGAPMVPQGVH